MLTGSTTKQPEETDMAGATTSTLFLDLDVLGFGDQASAYAGAAHATPATITARR
jgi:hypothetical protein